jgi:hypothetical protein
MRNSFVKKKTGSKTKISICILSKTFVSPILSVKQGCAVECLWKIACLKLPPAYKETDSQPSIWHFLLDVFIICTEDSRSFRLLEQYNDAVLLIILCADFHYLYLIRYFFLAMWGGGLCVCVHVFAQKRKKDYLHTCRISNSKLKRFFETALLFCYANEIAFTKVCILEGISSNFSTALDVIVSFRAQWIILTVMVFILIPEM